MTSIHWLSYLITEFLYSWGTVQISFCVKFYGCYNIYFLNVSISFQWVKKIEIVNHYVSDTMLYTQKVSAK